MKFYAYFILEKTNASMASLLRGRHFDETMQHIFSTNTSIQPSKVQGIIDTVESHITEKIQALRQKNIWKLLSVTDWSTREIPEGTYRAMLYGQNTLVIVGDKQIITSHDGVTWQPFSVDDNLKALTSIIRILKFSIFY